MKIAPTTTEDDNYLPASWRVLTALLRRAALTQAELRNFTGLSHPIIVQQVNNLRQLGLIHAGDPLYGRPGRPRIPLSFNWNFRRILSVDVHSAGITTRVMNLAGVSQDSMRTTGIPNWSPDGLRAALEKAITRALKLAGAEWAGIGIALPGGVSADGQTLLTCAGMPGCHPDPLAATLAKKFNLPVVLESHGQALAQGIWTRQQQAPTCLMALSLRHSPRVGMGLLVDGQRVPGIARDCAGLGTIRVYSNGFVPSTDHHAYLQGLLTAANDDAALRPQAMQALGMVAAHLATALSPDCLTLQGDAQWSTADTAHFQTSLREHGSPAMIEALAVDTRPAGPEESLIGVANLLTNRLLDFRQGVIASWLGE